MPAAKYFPTRSMVLENEPTIDSTSLSGDTSDYKTVWSSQYVDTQGWDPIIQTLHRAEETYSGDKKPHEVATWDKGLADSSDYKNTDDTDKLNSWTPVNPGAPNTEAVSSKHEGGFAGKCAKPRETWKVVGQGWECTGAVSDWRQVVLVPDIQINTEGGGEQTVKTGVTLMPYIVRTESFNRLDELSKVRSYREGRADVNPQLSVRDAGKAEYLSGVFVKCYTEEYTGSKTDPFSVVEDSKTEVFDASRDLKADTDDPISADEPIPILGKLDLKPGEKYTCNWGYQTSDAETKLVKDQGKVTNLANVKKSSTLWDKFVKEAGADSTGYSGIKQEYVLKAEKEDNTQDREYDETSSTWKWRN